MEADVIAFSSRLTDGVDEHGKKGDLGGDDEDGREPVGDQRDAERCGPPAKLGDERSLGVDLDEEHDRENDERRENCDAHDPLGRSRSPDKDRDSRADQREHDRQRHEPGHRVSSRAITFC